MASQPITQVNRLQALETVTDLAAIYRSQADRLFAIQDDSGLTRLHAEACFATAERLDEVKAVISDALGRRLKPRKPRDPARTS